ncbi:MAG: type IV pilus assembly protein PilM [Planctomycetes bacterium]|nr:type IV pilus assembly protein PilM [Planctomycetota bacterium]
MAPNRSLIGLDLGSREVKAIELTSTREGDVVTAFARRSVQEGQDPRGVLPDLLRTGGFRARRVATAVSGRSVIVRYISVARMDDEDLKVRLPSEADKYIPYDVAEMVLDGTRIGDEGDKPQMKVLLVAVKRSLIDEHVALLADVGLTPVVVDVDVFALENAFERYRATAEGAPGDDQVLALVDVGAKKTSINIVKGDATYFTREVYTAGETFSEEVAKKLGLEAPEAEALKRDPGVRGPEVGETLRPILDDLGGEIHLSFDYYENQFDQEVDAVYLSGGSSRLVGLERSFAAAFKKPVRTWDPVSALAVDRGVDQVALRAAAPQAAIAVGLACRLAG